MKNCIGIKIKEEIRNNHFKRMNLYRQSSEFKEYARAVGYMSAIEDEIFPSLLGNKWEINEEIYWEFIEMLPPVYCKSGFFMSELTFDKITTKFTKQGNKYFCEFART